MRHQVSDIKIEKINDDPKGLIAFCNFTVDGQFRFQGVAIFKRLEGGIRLSWPEKKRGIKKITTSFPVNPNSALDIESQIQEAINQNAEITK